MSKVLITGSSGFIGQYLADYLQENKYTIINTYRHLNDKDLSAQRNSFAINNIDAQTQWQAALSGCDVVVHLAARVHVMQETCSDPLSAFREVNTQGTMNLARQAVEAGVKRFVYLSSIKVNGEATTNSPFSADDIPKPVDPYAISKFEAEQQLLSLAQKTGLEVVIIRPPLVYGPAVKGNFRRLITLLEKPIPLPFAGIKNSRSLVNIQNLCSFIELCLTHSKAAGEVFLVSDGKDLSTTELFEKIIRALDKKSYLFYLPEGLIKLLTGILGRGTEFERLFGSLQVDILKNHQLLGWQPKVSIDEGIAAAVQHKQ